MARTKVCRLFHSIVYNFMRRRGLVLIVLSGDCEGVAKGRVLWRKDLCLFAKKAPRGFETTYSVPFTSSTLQEYLLSSRWNSQCRTICF